MNLIKRIINSITYRIKAIYSFCFSHLLFYYRRKFEKARFEKLAELKDKYKGQRCFLVGTGPSLTDEDVLKLRGENTFMVNSFALAMEELNFYPTFYGFIDATCMNEFGDRILKNQESLIFFPRRTNLSKQDYRKLRNKSNAYEFLMMYPGEWTFFSKKLPMEFSRDITQFVGWGYTVTYCAMQLLAYMGFSEIYLLGMDCSYPKGVKCYKDIRCAEEIAQGGHKKGAVVNEYIISYIAAKEYCDRNGIKVYNATRGGHLEVFPRVNLDEVVK